MDPEPEPKRSGVARALADLDPTATALGLTLITLLLRPVGSGAIRPAILLLAVFGLLVGPARRSAWLWLALAGLTGWRVGGDWPLADNHSYLLCYWCLALGLAARSGDPDRFAAANGSLLVGLAFSFAVLWKLISPDYLGGTFFRVTLLTDPRFTELTSLVTGLGPETFDASRRALWQHLDGLSPGLALPELSGAFHRLALFLTFWTIGLEAVVAICFLWPGRATRGARHGALLVFCATTFALLSSIASFGWLLLAMGLASCDAGRRRTKLAYLAVFALILVSRELEWLPAPG